MAARVGTNRGEAALALPGPAPFTISAAVDRVPTSTSEKVRGAVETDWVHVRIYVEGSDQPQCQ